jgi:hypothetical protein
MQCRLVSSRRPRSASGSPIEAHRSTTSVWCDTRPQTPDLVAAGTAQSAGGAAGRAPVQAHRGGVARLRLGAAGSGSDPVRERAASGSPPRCREPRSRAEEPSVERSSRWPPPRRRRAPAPRARRRPRPCRRRWPGRGGRGCRRWRARPCRCRGRPSCRSAPRRTHRPRPRSGSRCPRCPGPARRRRRRRAARPPLHDRRADGRGSGRPRRRLGWTVSASEASPRRRRGATDLRATAAEAARVVLPPPDREHLGHAAGQVERLADRLRAFGQEQPLLVLETRRRASVLSSRARSSQSTGASAGGSPSTYFG